MHTTAPNPDQPEQPGLPATAAPSPHEPILPEYYPVLKKEDRQGFPIDDDITLSDR